jgi:hypothetical protein
MVPHICPVLADVGAMLQTEDLQQIREGSAFPLTRVFQHP